MPSVGNAPVKQGDLDYPRLDSKAVLVRIGTNEICKADVEKLIDLRMKVIRLGLNESQKKFALNRGAIWTRLVASLPETYRRETALLDWGAKNGVVVNAADIAEYRKGFLRGCKADNSDFNEFLARNFTKAERSTAESRIKIEATCAKVRKTYLEQNPVVLDNAEVDAFLNRVKNYNVMANATNDIVWATATNIWERIKGGEDFKSIAGDLTEDEAERDESGEWGIYSLGDLEKEDEGALAMALSTLNVGEVTPPVESDNGIAIVHVDAITDAHGNELSVSGASRPFSAKYELSRIYLRLAQTYEIPDREECEAEIKAYKEQESFVKFASDLIKDDGVVYPCGKMVFTNAEERLRMPQMLMQEGVTKEDIEKARRRD